MSRVLVIDTQPPMVIYRGSVPDIDGLKIPELQEADPQISGSSENASIKISCNARPMIHRMADAPLRKPARWLVNGVETFNGLVTNIRIASATLIITVEG